MNSKHLKFYIASPFFTPEQLNRVKMIENTFDQYGLSYFSPRLEAPTLKNLSPKERLEQAPKVFQSNIDGLVRKECNVLLHVLDKDEGSAWESGFWSALNKYHLCDGKSKDFPILTFSTNDKPLNIMYRQLSSGHFRNEVEFIDFVSKIVNIPFDKVVLDYQNFGDNLT